MKTIEELAEWFQRNKVECRMYIWAASNWRVQIHCVKSDDGIKLEVDTYADTLFDAMYDAYEKFNRVISLGASHLLAPVIKHKPSPVPDTLDDIPF